MKKHNDSAHLRDLQALQARMGRWRRAHGGPGRRIPPELWTAAAELARRGDPDEVARALGLRVERLARLMGTGPAVGPGPAFVEISVPASPGGVSGAVTVVLEEPGGARLSLVLPAGSSLDVHPIITAFLGGGARCSS